MIQLGYLWLLSHSYNQNTMRLGKIYCGILHPPFNLIDFRAS
jgi:hypothetical protein